jgi:hypothetical protein
MDEYLLEIACTLWLRALQRECRAKIGSFKLEIAKAEQQSKVTTFL